MRRQSIAFALALTLLVLTGVALYLPGEIRDVPPTAPLQGFPTDVDGWKATSEALPNLPSIDPAARDAVALPIRRGDDGVWTTVFYYPRQTEGTRGLGRDLVFPTQGWADLVEQSVHLPAAGGAPPLSAHTVSVRVEQQRWTILYWYQLGPRTVASEHAYRAGVLFNRLVHHRADGALVRLVWPGTRHLDSDGNDAASVAFVRAFQAELRRFLPG